MWSDAGPPLPRCRGAYRRTSDTRLVSPRKTAASTLKIAAGISTAVAVACAAFIVVDPMAPVRFLTPQDALQRADAILVFSGDPDYVRTLEAVRLYRLGYAPYLVFSGRGGPGDSAESMAGVARAHGVPDRAIFLEGQATSTYENVLFVRELLARHRVGKLILVTSPYHQRRAYLVARHLLRGVVLINHAEQRSHWDPRGWWHVRGTRAIVVREYAKLAGYLMLGRI